MTEEKPEEKLPDDHILEFRTLEDAEEQGDLEAQPMASFAYTVEDALEVVMHALEAHSHKTQQIDEKENYKFVYWTNFPSEVKKKFQDIAMALKHPEPMVFGNKWHDDWLETQLKSGWAYSPDFDRNELCSPLILPYMKIPPEYQANAVLIWNVYKSLFPYIVA